LPIPSDAPVTTAHAPFFAPKRFNYTNDRL
jgi:hypothetical protein